MCERQRLGNWLWRGFEWSANKMQILPISCNHFWLSMGWFLGWVFEVKLYHENIANIDVLTDVAMATIFGFVYVGCTLVPHGEYDWTVRVRQRCGLMSNYSGHLLPYVRHHASTVCYGPVSVYPFVCQKSGVLPKWLHSIMQTMPYDISGFSDAKDLDEIQTGSHLNKSTARCSQLELSIFDQYLVISQKRCKKWT